MFKVVWWWHAGTKDSEGGAPQIITAQVASCNLQMVLGRRNVGLHTTQIPKQFPALLARNLTANRQYWLYAFVMWIPVAPNGRMTSATHHIHKRAQYHDCPYMMHQGKDIVHDGSGMNMKESMWAANPVRDLECPFSLPFTSW